MPAERKDGVIAWCAGRPRWQQALFATLLLMALISPWLADWLSPDRGFRGALDAAQAALQRGELSRDDGRGARELYQSVLAIQPDQPDAQQGLLAVREAALSRARQTIAARDYAAADAAIRLARELSASSAELQPLQLSLRDALLDDDGLRRWMQEASSRAAAGQYFGDAGALASYRRILALLPSHAPALQAREDLISTLLKRQTEMVRSGDLAQADAELRELESNDPAHFALPDARAALATAQEARRRWRDERLARASRALKRGDALSAGERYREVLAKIGDDETALEGFRQSREALLIQVESDLAELRLAKAQTALDVLQRWQVEPRRLQDLRRRLLIASVSRERQFGKMSAEEQQRHQDGMREAMRQGNWLSPPGDSAWDHLRRLRTAGLPAKRLTETEKAFNDAAWECQREALSGNRLRDAGICLEALQTAAPRDVRLRDSRAQLAQRWRDWASERIAKNQLGEAQHALQQAARWAPSHPEQRVVQQRLDQAGAASR